MNEKKDKMQIVLLSLAAVIFASVGFSEELCSTPEYQKALELNGDRLYTIASANDPVNVLLNAAVPEEHRMYIAANPEEESDNRGKRFIF